MSGELEVQQASAPVRVTPPKPKTDDWALVIGPVSQLAEQVANTDFVPTALRGKPAAVAAAILFGRELDMPPMQALNQVHVIEGRPSLSAEHMRAMVLAAGHSLTVTGDAGQATATGRRLLWRNPQTGEPLYSEPVTVTWTLAQARYAGLVTEKRKNWMKYPRAMLKARATAELCRDMFADITHGLDAVEEREDDDAVPSSEPKPTSEKVSRAKKGVTSRPAVGVGTAETPAPTATPTAPDSVTPPEVPLPGEEGPADSTPGEGLGNQSTSSPAGPPSMAEAQAADLEAYDPPRQCPNISNGQQCRYAAGHTTRGVPHTYGGGLQDPVSARHCDITKKHEPHAWNRGKEWFSCGGEEFQTPAESLEFEAEHGISPEEQRERYAAAHVVAGEIVNIPLPDSEGDGSPDDLAATAPEEVWEAAQDATGGPVEENDPPLSGGKRRLLLAAFSSLGVKDRAERLHTTSALLGRQVETWTTLTSGDGDRLIRAVNGLKTREELEKLVQRAAAEWGAQP